MNNNIVLSKDDKRKNEIAEVISLTIYHPVLSKVYEKNSIVSYLGEFCLLLDKPSKEATERIKLMSSLIYWDILFILIDNGLEVYADNVEKVNELSSSDIRDLNGIKKDVFLLNFAAANFYSFSHLRFVFPKQKNKTLTIMRIV